MKKAKINDVLGFDVDKYLMWHYSKIYPSKEVIENEEIPEFIGMPKVMEMDDIERKEYLKGFDNVKILPIIDGLGKSILSIGAISKDKFLTIFNSIPHGLELQLERLTEKVELGLEPEKRIIEKEFKAICKEFDLKIFDRISHPLPILEKDFIESWQLLVKVEYLKELNTRIEATKIEPIEESKKPVLKLPQKICLLYELGFFDNQKVCGLKSNKGIFDKIVSLLLDGDLNNTKKNINALTKPTNSFDPKRHEGILDKILNGETLG